MGKYDGSIKINTKIETKGAQVQLSSLENSIAKTADKIAGLRSKMDSLKDAKLPTKEYSALQAQLDASRKKFQELEETVKTFQKTGTDKNFMPFRQARDEAQELYIQIEEIQGKMFELEELGKAFSLGSETQEFEKLSQQLGYAEADLDVLTQKHELLEMKQHSNVNAYKKLAGIGKSAFQTTTKAITKANSVLNTFGRKLKSIAQKHMPSFRKEAQRTSTTLSRFSTRLKSLLAGLLIFNVISSGFRNMFSGVKEGFENIYEYNNGFKASVDSLRASLTQLQNAIAAAFAPIVQAAIPYLEKLISYLTRATNAVAQFIAALMGKTTYKRALKTSVGAAEGAAEAVDGVKDSAEEAEKALNDFLSPLDKLNVINSDKEISVDTGKTPDVSGGAGETVGEMFEDVPVDSFFADLAEKTKKVLSELFAPLKEAWDREGQFVMDSWEYALLRIGSLAKTIGSDFLEVWQQEATVSIFEDLLHIIGDIGLTAGHLARNFEDAWKKNETGKHILEDIRDIIGVIVENIRHAADVTVEWADNLSFSPLLEKFEAWTESLIPVMDNLSGIVTDFYEKVLLPLGKWTIEKGIPDLLQVLTDFNRKVDWEELRESLATLWEHLEPFAERVGEGLILFIGDLADALADFINSEEFDEFLTDIEAWMDNVSAEDVADALHTIADGIVAIKAAAVGIKVLSPAISLIGSLIKLLSGRKMLKAIQNVGDAGSKVGVLGKLKSAIKGGFGTGSLGTFLTTDIGALLGSGSAGTIAATVGTAIVGSLAAWFAGNWTGKQLGALLFPDMKEEYLDFHWLGEGGFFDQLFGGVDFTSISEVSELFATLGDALRLMGQDAEEYLKGKAANAFALITTMIPGAADAVSDFIEKTGHMPESVGEAVELIKEYIGGLVEEKLSEWKEQFLTKVEEWKERIKSALEELKEHIREKREEFEEKMEDLKEHIAEKLTDIKEKIKEKLEGIKSDAKEKLLKIKADVYEICGNIKQKVVRVMEKIAEKIASVLSSFNSLKSELSGSTLKVNVASAVQSGLGKIKIPGYATGQVIPTSMKKHIAMLGDNPRETEVVSPLSTIRQALREEMNQMGSGTTGDIVIQIDGKEVFRVTQKQAREYKKQTGNYAFS